MITTRLDDFDDPEPMFDAEICEVVDYLSAGYLRVRCFPHSLIRDIPQQAQRSLQNLGKGRERTQQHTTTYIWLVFHTHQQ